MYRLSYRLTVEKTIQVSLSNQKAERLLLLGELGGLEAVKEMRNRLSRPLYLCVESRGSDNGRPPASSYVMEHLS